MRLTKFNDFKEVKKSFTTFSTVIVFLVFKNRIIGWCNIIIHPDKQLPLSLPKKLGFQQWRRPVELRTTNDIKYYNFLYLNVQIE